MTGKLLCVLLPALLAGCTMIPDYHRPDMPVPEAWDSPAQTALRTGSAASIGWSTFFSEPHLQNLISLALSNNRDLRVAALNIERARGAYMIQRADLLPGVNATGASSNQAISQDLSSSGTRRISRAQTLQVGLASYELDLFGRIRSLNQNAIETYLGTEEACRSVQLSLVSEVATAYLALAGDRERLGIARETLANQQSSYGIVQRRYEAGISSELALRQAQTSVDQARVDIARYTGLVAQDITALRLLVGADISPELMPAAHLADLAPWPELPVGLPSGVLLSRPDILQAEHQLKAANASIGAARANFFPRIALTASIGTGSTELYNLFNSGMGTWNFTPSVSLPLFEGGRNVANLRVSETDREIAAASYEKAIQTAFKEVSDSLTLKTTLEDQVKAQQSLTTATSEAYRLSSERYTQGIDSYLSVLDSQRSMYSAQLNLVDVRENRDRNLITLYRVLGGGVREKDVR